MRKMPIWSSLQCADRVNVFCYFVCYFYFAFSGDVVILRIYCYCTVSIICFLYVDVEHTD